MQKIHDPGAIHCYGCADKALETAIRLCPKVPPLVRRSNPAAMPAFELFAVSAEDVLAISMVALISFALGMIVTILLVMARSGSRHESIEADFLEEEEEENPDDEGPEATSDQPSKGSSKEIWEKDSDWWKK